MIYTIQLFVAGYAGPQGTDVEYHYSVASIKRAVQWAHDRAERVGAGYEPTEALIWKGELDDTTDVYPDGAAKMGPRGGVRINWSV